MYLTRIPFSIELCFIIFILALVNVGCGDNQCFVDTALAGKFYRKVICLNVSSPVLFSVDHCSMSVIRYFDKCLVRGQ